MSLLKICNKVIEYSFCALFFLVPLVFTSATSELFELNKMWLTWGLTIIIAACWLAKMILERKINFQRTPLDIPIALFLLSQIVSTIFSLDFHVSLWGYYSRFNGGLLSIISYILLYYAFLSNSPTIAKVQRLMTISLISGLIVALWGLPSHFGYDPTCLLFRGTLDVSCWTADFMPTVRIFSTLGQPDWLAAYLAILIPIAIASIISAKLKNPLIRLIPFLLLILFYIDLLYTRARSGFLGIWLALAFFAGLYIFLFGKKSILNLKSLILILVVVTFVIGTPINQLHKFTLPAIISHFQKPAITEPLKQTETQKNKNPTVSGGTESADIRFLVWEGAINAWKSNPLFGTGVETFAFAYYKYKPIGHNMVSEWNFLYNKAHNEYLNYLATTGIFGLGSYLIMIGYFLFLAIKKISKSEFLISNQAPNSKSQLGQLEIRSIRNLTLALLAGYIPILVTNFFGFSVVITNIYLFMIPAFVFILSGAIKPATSDPRRTISGTTPFSFMGIFFILATSCFLLITLFRFWRADIAYALGYNLDRAGEYQEAYPNLHKAVEMRGSEPVFKDELSVNNAILAAGLLTQEPEKPEEQTISVASTLAQKAINTSNEIISQYPNNVVFWKTRTKLFYTLSQVDSRYLSRALDSIKKASLLAPNDANITYNLGVLHGQNNDLNKGIEALEKTIKLKPNYRDAHYALGLFYEQNKQKEKAIEEMEYILKNISPTDSGAKESLENWGK